MSVLLVVQARLGSQRFPRKVLADLMGRPIISHVIERARQIHGVDHLVLAVPHRDVGELSGYGAETIGPPGVAENDVLGRFQAVAARYPKADPIVRITADCPMLDPRIAEQVLALYHSDPQCEYASNVAPFYRDGEDVEVFSRGALEWAHRSARKPFDRQHVCPWVTRHVKCLTLLAAVLEPKKKTSIDVPADLEYVRSLLEASCLAR